MYLLFSICIRRTKEIKCNYLYYIEMHTIVLFRIPLYLFEYHNITIQVNHMIFFICIINIWDCWLYIAMPVTVASVMERKCTPNTIKQV